MLARRGVVIRIAVPPFADLVVGVGVVIDDDERAAVLHPVCQWFVNFGRERFLAVVAQEQRAEASEVVRDGYVFQLHGSYGHAAFKERQCEPIDVAHVRIARRGLAALEHQGIAHEDAKAGGAAIPFDATLLHVFEGIHHGLQFRRVRRWNWLAFF